MVFIRESTKVLQQCFPRVIGAEIGVCFGDNARNLFTHIPNLYRLHLIDDLSELKGNGFDSIDYTKELGRALMNVPKEQLIWHIKPSVDAAKEVDDNSLDFAYIDANHSYDYVLEDCRIWWKKVRVGGILCGHDFANNGPASAYQVAKAVGDFAQEINAVVYNDQNEDDWTVAHRGIHDWWIFKNG